MPNIRTLSLRLHRSPSVLFEKSENVPIGSVTTLPSASLRRACTKKPRNGVERPNTDRPRKVTERENKKHSNNDIFRVRNLTVDEDLRVQTLLKKT